MKCEAERSNKREKVLIDIAVVYLFVYTNYCCSRLSFCLFLESTKDHNKMVSDLRNNKSGYIKKKKLQKLVC